MDANFNIYSGENVPPEDKARLDGFLKGREEASLKADIEAAMERLRKAEEKA